MKIRIKQGHKFIIVDVNHKDCRKRSCFYYGKYTHHNPSGYSGVSSRTDEHYSCLRRDNQGCPKAAGKGQLETGSDQSPDT